MKKFEEGHAYRADDSRFGAVVVEKRTAKMVFVSNQDGVKWGMKIRTDNNGNEYAF